MANSVEQLSKEYYVPGLSEARSYTASSGPWTINLSNVGFNIIGSRNSGVTIHPQGPDHFVVPKEFPKGEITGELPEFYRLIGHSGILQAWADVLAKNPKDRKAVVKSIQNLVGVKIDESFKFGHHGDNQVAMYNVTEYTDGNARPVIVGDRHVNKNIYNPFEFDYRKTISFDGENGEELVETYEYFNTSDQPIFISHINHPYIGIHGGESAFQGSNVYVAVMLEDGSIRRTRIYELKNYKKKDEKYEYKGPLPLARNNQWVEMESKMPDGTYRIVNVSFHGQYNEQNPYPSEIGEDHVVEKAAFAMFSPGPNEDDFVKDLSDKIELYYKNLRESAEFLVSRGYNIEDLGLPSLDNFDEVAQRVKSQIVENLPEDFATIAMEDLTSSGLIYRKKKINQRVYIFQ